MPADRVAGGSDRRTRPARQVPSGGARVREHGPLRRGLVENDRCTTKSSKHAPPGRGRLRPGELLRIVDIGGNQAVDFLIYNANDTSERYSAPDTIVAQRNIFLVTGTQLMSSDGNAMMTIVDTNCPRHDTIGGACSRESNSLRYGHHTAHQHACVDNFLSAGSGAMAWASATSCRTSTGS